MLSRREWIQRAGIGAAASLFLEAHGHKAFAQAAAAPGTAILCGMDFYPLLRGDGKDLRTAGTNSVGLLIPALKQHGFTDIHHLKNPTQQEISEAFRKFAKPRQRLVFYFLGHGSRDEAGNGTLLCADAADEKNKGNLRREELRLAVTKLIREDEVLVTAFIDACHSWAVAFGLGKGEGAGKAFPLSYPQFKSMQQAPLEDPDADDRLNAGCHPCFFTAAGETEKAWVATIPDKNKKMIYVGVFTHSLSRMLQAASPGEVWENIHRKTSSACFTYSEKYKIPRQTPHLSPIYSDVKLFKGKKGELDLSHLFELNLPDAKILSVAVKPVKKNVSPVSIPVGAQFSVNVTTKQAGYLIALEKTPDNQYHVHFPATASVEAAKVEAQTTLRLPTNSRMAFHHDALGRDTFKVFLYRDKESAAKLLKMINDLFGKSVDEKNSKTIRTSALKNGSSDVVSKDLITATHTFDVQPGKDRTP